MSKFLLSIISFLFFVIISIFGIFSLANGYADPFYMRFTTPKQSSLILGTSRAAQGIQPIILNRQLSRNDFFNYSFSGNLSPYGPAYLESIQRKLNPQTRQGIFILSVDPWSISTSNETFRDSTKMEESDLTLGKLKSVNEKPNFHYLWNWYDQHYWELIKSNSKTFLHQDGWLEVSVPMDSISILKRRENKVEEYKKRNLPFNKFSKARYDYLIKIIEYLKNYGHVYLIRLPMHPSIMDIEQQLMPDFNDKIAGVLKETGVNYYDMTTINSAYTFTDGNHLYKESGKKVTERIATWIREQNK